MTDKSEITIKRADIKALQFIKELKAFGESLNEEVNKLNFPADKTVAIDTPEMQMAYFGGVNDALTKLYDLFKIIYLNEEENKPKRISKRGKK